MAGGVVHSESGRGWLGWLLVCVLCTQTALNLARPLLSYRVISLGGEALAIGLVTAAYALLSLVAAVPLGRLTDRTNRIHWIILMATVLLGGAALLMALSPSIGLVALAGTLLGLGHVAFMVAGQGTIARRSAEENLDRDFGWFTAATSAGQMLGPLIAGLALGDARGEQLQEPTARALVVAGTVALVGVLGVWGMARAGTHRPTAVPGGTGERVGVWPLLRRPGVGVGLFVSLALLASVDLLTAYLPLVAEKRGIAPAAAGSLLALRAGASIASRLLLGRLVARFSRRGLIFHSTLGSALCLGIVAAPLGEVLWPMASALAVGGFLLGIGQPLTMTGVVRAVPREARGTALALRLWANRLGQVALPAAAGLVASSLGAAGALWFACAVLAGAAGSARLLPRR